MKESSLSLGIVGTCLGLIAFFWGWICIFGLLVSIAGIAFAGYAMSLEVHHDPLTIAGLTTSIAGASVNAVFTIVLLVALFAR